MIDTKFFDEKFKARLLAAIPDLDEQCDGVIIRSENFQALRLLQERYKGQVKCIYIDPPYNSKTTEILYKNTYRDSSWLSLMMNRLEASRKFGVFPMVIAIDENEQEVLSLILKSLYPDYDKTCVSVVHNKKGIQGDYFSFCHEFGIFCIPPGFPEINGKPIPKEQWEYSNLRKWGRESDRSTAKNCFYPIYVKDMKIIGFGDVCKPDEHPAGANVEQSDGSIAIYPIETGSNSEKKWRYERGTVESIMPLLKVVQKRSGEIQIHRAKPNETVKTVWNDSRYIAGDFGTKWLTNLGIKVSESLYPKSLYTVEDSIFPICDSRALVFDYFGGSGTTAHAVIDLNRQDGGHRKYILVEMGEHFETVLKPRIEKVVYSADWNDGKPQKPETGVSHCFKYLTLESYEDTLGNLKLETPQAATLFDDTRKSEYLLNYMLEIESRDSLLNTDTLRHPFDYTLDIAADASGATVPTKVDLVETFNYLVGLRVESEDRHIDKGFVLVTGVLPGGEDAIVVWRDCNKVDNAALRKILERRAINPREQGLVLFVNGDHDLPNAITGADGEEKAVKVRSLDAEFLSRMFGE